MRTTLIGAALMAATSLVAVVSGPSPSAVVAPLHCTFTVNVTSGPNAGDVLPGSFSFDSSSVVPGGAKNAAGRLTALAFTFNGTSYTQATVNTGSLLFDAGGSLTRFLIGTDRFAGLLNSPGPGMSTGIVQFAPTIAAVPAPAALVLLGAGLGLTRLRRLPAAAQRSGKDTLFGFFVGQVIKAVAGKGTRPWSTTCSRRSWPGDPRPAPKRSVPRGRAARRHLRLVLLVLLLVVAFVLLVVEVDDGGVADDREAGGVGLEEPLAVALLALRLLAVLDDHVEQRERHRLRAVALDLDIHVGHVWSPSCSGIPFNAKTGVAGMKKA